MRAELAIAAASCFVLASGHTAIGVRWVLPKLADARLPRTPLGSAVPMLRFTWHVVTVLLLSLGVLLGALAVAPDADPRTLVLRWAAAAFAAATALAVWMNRRHLRSLLRLPVPFLFVLIAAMCWAASAG